MQSITMDEKVNFREFFNSFFFIICYFLFSKKLKAQRNCWFRICFVDVANEVLLFLKKIFFSPYYKKWRRNLREFWSILGEKKIFLWIKYLRILNPFNIFLTFSKHNKYKMLCLIKVFFVLCKPMFIWNFKC